jgi:hypothetical protein
MDTSDQAIQERLSELGTLGTVSAFCRTFYRLIAELVTATDAAGGVRVAFAGLLEVELRYHRELQHLAESHQVTFADLQSAAERHRIGLHAVCEYAGRLEGLEALAEAARDLVLAEGHYHLRHTAEVVSSLERVVSLGLQQPLVQFALGYNRYLLALETCTEPTESGQELVLHNPLSFRLQCLQAVSALEEGLQDTALDGQLYWWMGVILEAAGLTEAAQDAYDKSADVLQGEEEQEMPASPTITEEEIREAGEALEGPFDPAALSGWEQDDR